MHLITMIKAGDCGHAVRIGMKEIGNDLRKRGAEVIIAGCTEIPLALEADSLEIPVVSSTEALARETVLACGGKLKKNT
jgi:aspartate racemase